MSTNKNKLDIDKEKFGTVSYSQYSLYTQCQYRWYLDYVKKLKVSDRTIDLTFGTSFHEVFQDYLEVLYNQSSKKADSIDFREALTNRVYDNYKAEFLANGSVHFTTAELLKEYIEDGVIILEWVRRHRAAYFSLRDWELVGIEIPIKRTIIEDNPNVLMIGFIDLVLKNKKTGKYYVMDIKTSRHGWNDNAKKDQTKINQVLFYKRFYSQELNVPEDDIEVSFFIVRRKLYENLDFPMKRVQEFKPAQGTMKVRQAHDSLAEFVRESFTPEGKYIDREYPKNPEKCKYCPYAKKPELCSRNKKK
jgi:hypothetical protein